MTSFDCFIHTNNIRLHYLDHPGGEPPVVLLPGLTANAHNFDGLVLAGLSPRFRALLLDLRGRGLTDQPETGYAMADHAADVIGMLDGLGLEQVVLGGHSFGGLLSLYIAANFPDRVSQLVIMDAAFALATVRTRDAIRPSLARLGQVTPSWEAYLDAIKRAPYLHDWWDPAVESYYRADVRTNEDGSVQPRSRPETIAQAMDGVLAEPWQQIVSSIRQPVLLLNAIGPYGPPGAPPLLSPEQARETAGALADCRYVEVPGNHVTMLYGPGAQRIVHELRAFVQTSRP